MKLFRRPSLIICFVCLLGMVVYRGLTLDGTKTPRINVLAYDALGYYMYLPGIFIYNDITELKWYEGMNAKYKLSPTLYQAYRYKNGNYVTKYLIGISIMYSPFFFAAHYLAPVLGYPADGFSLPYQWAICVASLLYAFLALLLLRKVLLHFYSETVAAISILLVTGATNYAHYAVVDAGMTHTFLFSLYAFQLYATLRWYQKPNFIWAIIAGFLVGLSAIARPTDAVMLLVPLLWGEFDKESSSQKWQMVKQHWQHIVAASVAGIIGVLPQLLYWKYASGDWIYNVGSKWTFLNPWWRVLFGFEKGWFVYTPITMFFVAGLFLLKGKPFKRMAIWFFIINTWIIISWFEWRYGASYSCRALVQSYAILILPFAAAIDWCLNNKWKYAFAALWVYLLGVNIFQLYQYEEQIIHYDDMNAKYYSAIYLNPNPTPLQMSLLDTRDYLRNEANTERQTILQLRDTAFTFAGGSAVTIAGIDLDSYIKRQKENWIKVEMDGVTHTMLWQSFLTCRLVTSDTTTETNFRFYNALNKQGEQTRVAFYKKLPDGISKAKLEFLLKSEMEHNTRIKTLQVEYLTR